MFAFVIILNHLHIIWSAPEDLLCQVGHSGSGKNQLPGNEFHSLWYYAFPSGSIHIPAG